MTLLLTKAPSSGGGGSGETNTASNVNVGGVGAFKQKTGVNLEFRGVNVASSKLTVTLDAPNNEIDLDFGTVTLDNLSDVIITAPVVGQLLRFNGVNWVNATTSSSGAYDTIQEEGTALTQRSILNFVGAGLTAVDNSLNSRTDVLLGNDLNALELLSSTGLAARVTTDVWALRGLVAPSMGFTITNPDGVAGNPTFILANDLSAVEGLTTIGVAVRTNNALETWTTRTLVAGTNISITNPDGVAGNITIATTGVVTGTAYQTVQDEGVALTQRSIINFIGTGITAVDNAGSTRTDVSLDTDLNALASTVTTGLYTITGIGTSATRTITAGSSKISVLNGDGVAGNPTIDVVEASLSLNSIGGVLSISKGGTSNTTAITAFNALSPLTTKGDVLTHDGINNVRLGVGTNGQVLTADSTQTDGIKWATPTTGTVTSVALSDGSTAPIYMISGSPVTSSGTLTFTLSTQTANLVFAGPSSGGAAQPTFRTLVSADLPVVPISKGGTGNTTAITAFNALSPLTTKGDVLTHDGTNNVRLPVGANNFALVADSTVTDGVKWAAIVNSVTLTQPVAGLTITNSGVAQTDSAMFTFALANDLGAIEALNTNGILTRTGTDTWAARTITGTAGNIVVTDGSGVAGNPTINLAAVVQGVGGSFLKFTLDGFGRITANTAVVAADITVLVDPIYVNVSGDTMTGFLTLSADPTSALHAATKQYVDNAITGLDFKNSVRAATTANITLSGTQTIDGVSVVVGNRVLVKNQTIGADNGIYVVSAGAWTRATDADNSGSASEVTANMYAFVEEGTTNADSGWVLSTNDPITLGTTSLTFTQFTGLGQITAGAGLTKTGNTIDVNTVSTARIVVNVDDIDLAFTGTAGTYNVVTFDAYGRETSGFLRSLTPPAAGITVSNADGVAGNPTLALANDLSAIEGLSTTGLATRTATDTWTTRTLVAPAAGVTITNPAGIAGDPTFALANDLSAVEGLSTTGIAVRTATDTWTTRTLIAGTNISITNPDGVAGNITIATTGVVAGTAYQTVQDEGVALTARSIINFIGTGITAVDNAGSTRTDVSIDADLNAIASFAGTGFAVRTAADTWAQRTLVAPVAGLTITNPAGIAGDPTFALANDLGAIEALNTNGLFARTATDTFAARTITAGANITVTNGDGIAGNPTIALTGTIVNSITLTQPAAGLTLTNSGVTQTGAVTSTFALANDLGAIEALNTNGILTRTATDTWAARTIVAGSTKITVTNGSGVAGNPSIDFGTVTFDDLSDVIITAPTSGQLVRFNGTNWVNVSTNNVLRLYSENPSAETTPLVAGTNAVAIGTGSSASGTRAFARGNQSLARLQDESAFASGSFTTAGDAQVRQFIVRTQTTNATITEAFIDGTGGAVRMVLPNDTTWVFSIWAAARRTDADNESAGYDVSGAIDRNTTAASTALVGAVSKTVLAEDNAAWDITVDADTTNGSLRVRFTGQAAKTINWVAYCRITEVTG